ncbi:MAG: hypothetical protein HWD60_10120 [Defluviicoccus sp.]|nr:MAG: hypothetical protein HWD60_10120 [Defluviicoccus sp.]
MDPGNVDEEKIIFWMKHIMAIEQENDWILRSRNFPCVDLVYEDIAGNTRLALELVQNHLGIEKYRFQSYQIGSDQEAWR